MIGMRRRDAGGAANGLDRFGSQFRQMRVLT
jgi:hypothetical protein